MSKVTKESLAENIDRLEWWLSVNGLTMREEFQLEAYRMLHDFLQNEDSRNAAEEDFDV